TGPLRLGATPPPVFGPVTRSVPQPVAPFGFQHPASAGRGELRAALLIAHGAVRRFFRYFPLVGDTIDDRLLETLALAHAHAGVDRVAAWRTLRRFGEALHDGPQRVNSFTSLGYVATLPVWLEHIDGRADRPVIRRSRAPGLSPGDVIVALEGRPIADVYA